MRSVRTGQDGSYVGPDDVGAHDPPVMRWDDDEAATHAYQWEDPPSPALSREDHTRSDNRLPRARVQTPARVIPLLRAPRPGTPRGVEVPSLRAHIEAQRAAAERAVRESHIRSHATQVVIAAPPAPREVYTQLPTAVSVHMHPPAPYPTPQPPPGGYPPSPVSEREINDGEAYAPSAPTAGHHHRRRWRRLTSHSPPRGCGHSPSTGSGPHAFRCLPTSSWFRSGAVRRAVAVACGRSCFWWALRLGSTPDAT